MLELVALWNRLRTTANTVTMPMGPKAYRPLVDAVRRRSLDAWEATFQRVEASDYLAGRADLPGLTLWDAIDRAERIDSGQYDNRQAPADREQASRQAVVEQALANLAAKRAPVTEPAPTAPVPAPQPMRNIVTMATPEAIAAALRPLQRRLKGRAS